MTVSICEAILGVLLSPVFLFCRKGCSLDVLICTILYVLSFGTLACVYAFNQIGYESLLNNVLCVFLPPVPIFYKHGCSLQLLMSLVLLILGWIPSIIFAYYETCHVDGNGDAKQDMIWTIN